MASRRRVGLSGILFLSFIQSISTQCPEPIYSVHNHHLGDHVMSTSVVLDLSDCRKKCSKEFYCKSINYRLLNKSCDLNSADRYSHPPDYGPREGYVYMDTANRRRRKVGFKSCSEIRKEFPSAQSGYYWVIIEHRDSQVYCDMDNFDGGWTLVVSISSTNNDHLQRNAKQLLELKIIPRGPVNFDSSCDGANCPRIISSHYYYPYKWETNTCTTISVGYHLSINHKVFDFKDNGECGNGVWKSSLYPTSKRGLYGYPRNSVGIWRNRTGLLYVKYT
ncbi:hypothetical protein OS493_018949 [Desmophyllum pertusum]|uniref:Apple domain-containing protein n=1 Tax=Desmophyllum pertusum TaxID=174260 RepID=A0A9W9Z2F0_9CNID|nr:hypothetical protein OS493_018949 [Desmophyllum pertusum]